MIEKILGRPWWKLSEPKRILAIRLQALGDVVITLPYLLSLKQKFSTSRLDFLTRKEVENLPRHLDLFDNIYSIGGGRNFKKQILAACILMPKLLWRRYDVIVDLQANLLSRWVRKILNPQTWSEFDRFSPLSAGERTLRTIEVLGFNLNSPLPVPILKNKHLSQELIDKYKIERGTKTIILNPAGFSLTKNWPIQNYIALANLFLENYSQGIQFVILGIQRVAEKADYLKTLLKERLINLVNQTTPAEAYAIIQKADLMISEDSGLMHMAWVAGIPTIALFGSTRSDWSRPLGKYSKCFDSSDLPCGECMKDHCRFDDVHCLTRYSAQFVFQEAIELLKKSKEEVVSAN